MELIVTGRQMGKTTKMIKAAAESGAYILVMNRDEATRIAYQAEQMKVQIRYPVTFAEFFGVENQMRGSRVRKVMIDNAEEFIRHACPGLDVEAVSFTYGVIPPEVPDEVKKRIHGKFEP